jgi:hypothetical protein
MSPGTATVTCEGVDAAPGFFSRRSESRFEADRAGEGRTAMPISGCNRFGASELTAALLAFRAPSFSASHRSHGNGEVAK